MSRLRSWVGNRERRRRDEQGVIAIMVALITCFTVIPLAAYAVDIGVQRVARRDAQAVADLVALDLARQLDGRNYGQLQSGLQALADKSAARNAGGDGVATVVPELGTLDKTKWTSDPSNYFTPITSSTAVPNAVRVRVSDTVNFSIHGGKGGVVRTAIGTTQSSACFTVGSFALNLDSSKSALLNILVNDALNLSAIGYQGLANANVTLGQLAAELGAGSTDGLLNLTDLSLGDLYLASAKALQKAGGETADIDLLNQLATANIGSLPHIKFSDLIDLEAGNNAALGTSINLLNIVAGGALVANGTHALAVPSLTVGVPSITGVTTSLKVIQKPVYHCSANPVKTSQIDLAVDVTVANLNILLFQAVTTVKLNLNIAEATATRTNAFCGNPEGIDVAVASGLASLSLVPNIDLKLLGLSIARVSGSVGTVAPAATNTVQFRHPPDPYPTVKSIGSNAILPNLDLASLNFTLLGVLPLGVSQAGILSAVLSTIVTPILNPLIGVLNTALLTPLTSLLGVKLGGADLLFEQPPTCNNPVLAG